MKISYSLQTSLQNKLIVAMGLMLLPLVALAVGSLFFLHNMNDALHKVTHGVTENFQPITHLQTLVLEAMYTPHHYLIYGYSEEPELFARLSQEVNKAFTDVLATSNSEQKQVLVVSAQEEWWQVRAISEAILGIPQPRQEPVTREEMADLHAHIDRVVDILDQLHSLAVREADEAHEQAHATAQRTLLLTITVFGVGLGLAIVAVILLVRSILVPIRLLEQGANHLGKGDLSHRVPLVSKDEMGGLAKAFNAMAEKLRKSQATLEELAIHDGLTGLYNHREFYQRLEAEMERAKRYRDPLSLLMMDIDHFKAFNDTYGHQAGDSVLRALSALIRKEIRSVDHVARYGGEEFAVILPQTPSADAFAMAERLRNSIVTQAININKEQVVNVTVSVGVAAFPEDAKSRDDLIAAADQALYTAKHAGRNRVCRSAQV